MNDISADIAGVRPLVASQDDRVQLTDRANVCSRGDLRMHICYRLLSSMSTETVTLLHSGPSTIPAIHNSRRWRRRRHHHGTPNDVIDNCTSASENNATIISFTLLLSSTLRSIVRNDVGVIAGVHMCVYTCCNVCP
jgi:hypothetical protein